MTMWDVITDAELEVVEQMRAKGFAVVVLNPKYADRTLVESAMCGAGDYVINFFVDQSEEPSELTQLCRDFHVDD